VEVGQHFDLGPSVDVEVLHADVGDDDSENNNSVVLRVTYGAVRLLLGGDCESDDCEASFDAGPIDVYKVHHHGSQSSSSPEFLRSMAPTLALISAGEDNDYGHPDDDTLDALDEAGAEVWRTDEVGTIRVDVDGVGYSLAPAFLGRPARSGPAP
jgi:competence protein ComEC